MNSLLYQKLLQINGGQGSGDWGHAGRPGEVGGSSGKKSGGSACKMQWGGNKEFGSKQFRTAVNSSAKELSEEFGVSFEHVKVVQPNVFKAMTGKDVNKVDGETILANGGTIWMSFNDHEINDAKVTEVDPKKFTSVELGIRPSELSMSLNGLVKHEFGHAIVNELATEKTTKELGKPTNAEEEKKYFKAVKKNVETIYKRAAEAGRGESVGHLFGQEPAVDEMSKYGLTNDAEFVAESISAKSFSHITKKTYSELKKIAEEIHSASTGDRQN